jgi:hypothetical protein
MGDSSGKWNFKNPAVKRILRELKEIQQDSNPDIVAEALEVGIFESVLCIRELNLPMVVLGFALL